MNRMVELAKSYIGYNEKDGTYKKFIDTYNSQSKLARGYKAKYSDPWCAIFVSALAIELGLTDIIPTEVGCERMLELFKKNGDFIEDDAYNPAPGDIIFYDWQDNGKGDNKGWSDHVGIIEQCSDRQIKVIEGNKNDEVGRRILKPDSQYIRGYGVPRYSEEDREKIELPEGYEDVTKPGTIDVDKNKSIDDIAREVIAGGWGNGEERKRRLELAGLDYNEVQGKVNEILGVTAKEERYGTVRVTSCLRVRRSPTTASNNNIITTLSNGTRVKIEREQNGWYQISSPVNGWVSASYVK